MQINQIVKGKRAGVFVILGFREITGIPHAQVKEVDPKDYTRTAPGELALPIDCLQPIN